ncbi:hypothetical protein Q7P36_001861 [Cladosporium allicinum]
MSQADIALSQINAAASRASAAPPPAVASNGSVTAPKRPQSLTPTPVPQVSVVPASPNGTASIPAQGQWRVGLFDADDMDTCCAAWFVPCVLNGRINQRLANFPQEKAWDEFNSDCCVSLALCCCYMGCVPAYMNRNAVRRFFNIKGNACLDCLASFFCTPCALSQTDFELKRRAVEARGISQQYQSGAPQMAYMPQPQQRMIQQQPQMQPPNAAYLQVPSHSQPQTTSRTQQSRPVQATEQPQTQPTAQQAPQLLAIQFSPPRQH